MTWTAWLAVAVFATAYVLIAAEWVHRVAAAVGGAALMLLIGATDAEHAFFSPDAGIDWNVIFLLIGMMLVVAVLKRTGAFEYVAIWSVKRARGRPFRVMTILVLVTAVASAMMDNVTTVLLVAPVTFLVCERLAVPVAPFLIAEAIASNIGGTATLVGDPPNIIIGSRGGLSYNDFLIHLAPLVAVLLVVLVVLCRWLFRAAFRYDPTRVERLMHLQEREAIQNGRLLAASLVVLAVVTAAFMLHTVLHLEPSVVSLTGGLVLLALSRLDHNLGVRQDISEALRLNDRTAFPGVQRGERVSLRPARMSAGGLDQRHVRAEVREDPAAQPPRRLGQVEHPNPVEERLGYVHASSAAVTSAAETTSAINGKMFSAEKRCHSSGKDAQQSSTTTTRSERFAAPRTNPSTA